MNRSIARRLIPVLMLVGLLSLLLPAGAAADAKTFNVQVGAASTDHAVETWQFYPATITIDAGDTVVWHFGDSVHLVSFGTVPTDINQLLAPAGSSSYDGTGFASSGLILALADITKPLPTYTLTFPKPGTYNYAVTFHPTMKGSVVVQAAGAAYPAGQDSYQAASDPNQIAALKAGAAALAAEKATSTQNANGTATYAMTAGDGDNQTYGLLRFGVGSLTIHVGDTVTWTQKDVDELHTVTFLDQGKDVPFFIGGKLNPVGATPAGDKVYNGSGFFNSGVLTPTKSYSLTFSKAGTFNYICLIHDELGMKATITVIAAAVPAGLPRTGGVPAEGLVLGLAGIGLIFSGIVIGRRAQTVRA